MKLGILVAIAFVVAAGGTLALMNNACKTSRDSWCTPKAPAPQLSIAKRWPAG